MSIIKVRETINSETTLLFDTLKPAQYYLIAFLEEKIAGLLSCSLDPSKRFAGIKEAKIVHAENEEDKYDLKYGLLRFAMHLLSQDVKSQISEKKNKIENFFSVFTDDKSEMKILPEAHFCFDIKQLVEEFFIVPHGEILELAPGVYYVMRGAVEKIIDPESFHAFQEREIYHQGDYFNLISLVARTESYILKIKNADSALLKTPAKKIITAGKAFYNNYFLIYIIDALQKLGWFDYIKGRLDDSFNLEKTIAALQVKPELFEKMLRFLSFANMLEFDKTSENYRCNKLFIEEIQHDLGYIQFVINGYADVLKEMAPIAKGEKIYGKDVHRNDEGVHMFYYSYKLDVEKYLLQAIADVQPKHVAHIGCGSARRLVQLCHVYPDLRATGIDMDAQICELARQHVQRSGFTDRIKIVTADVCDFVKSPHPEIDLMLFIAGMFHDFQNMPGGAQAFLEDVSQSIASNGYLIVEDQNINNKAEPNFPLSVADGFEFLHTLMGAKLFTREEYVSLFESSGWKVEMIRSNLLSKDWIYVLKNTKA